MKKIISIIIALGALAFLFFYLFSDSVFSGEGWLKEELSYQEILAQNISPALAPDYDFPISFQYLNGCYAFAVNNILLHKYEKGINLLEAEKTIEKPRNVLWDKNYRNQFNETYDIELKYSKSAKLLFALLKEGEPVMLRYQYPLGDDEWVLHVVAAYSFDQEGIWVSETLSGKLTLVPYDKIFDESGKKTLYTFSTVVREG
jgi:hypothetical protein